MSDERMQSALDEWFEDTDPRPPNVRRTATRVMAQLPQTRQRGRWLPFRLFRPKAQTPTAIDTTDYQPRPISATNGHSAIAVGRTQTMFSPVKAITAGAIMFAIGGVLLIAQPFNQQSSVPGAATDVSETVRPALITGTVVSSDRLSGGTTRGEGIGILTEGYTSTAVWEASDERLSGEVTYAGNWLTYAVPNMTAEAGTFVLVNEGGRWVGQTTALTNESGIDDSDTIMFIGEDGYEGQTARVIIDWSTEPPTFSGGVIPGDWPAFPSPE